jgi:ribosome maturation factor RimP
VLRLTIERPGAPTALADCEAVSRAVEHVLDTVDFIPGRYSLEVASAGLTRPLRTLPDFTRAVGTLVRVVPRNGGAVTGRLRSASESGITVEEEGGGTRTIALDEVATARREIDMFIGKNRP